MFSINEEYLKGKVPPIKRVDFPKDLLRSTFPDCQRNEKEIANDVAWKHRIPEDDVCNDWNFRLFICSLLLTMQLGLSNAGYSGYGKPPMHGDFEAQRHWMEITYHLPISEWYKESPRNNLTYWGLDYPPLTAYHSYAMGVISHMINPSWVALELSHGIETPEHKLFMRMTAIVPFLLIYLPAIFSFCRQQVKTSSRSYKVLFLLVMVTYPGLLAIDNAHFQYNSVSLGLFLWAYVCLTSERLLLGSFCFVCAINYKQMELYHSLPIFVFILARSIHKPFFSRIPQTLGSLVPVAAVVLASFFVIWSPFLYEGTDSVIEVIRRIFPFSRGLFEDKVASVWCAFSPIIKFNRLFDVNTQLRMSTALVLLGSFPSLAVLFVRPSPRNFRLSLLAVSLSFFLFSFQVHEKSVLLPAICALLLLPEHPQLMSLFLHISNTSMLPLCIKDGNAFLLLMFAVYFVMMIGLFHKPTTVTGVISIMSGVGALFVCVCELALSPPSHLPHLFPLLNAFYSCCHFLALLTYVTFVMVREEWSKRVKGGKAA